MCSLPCFSGCHFALKSSNNLALFSLTIRAMPHCINFFPFLLLITYVICFPLLIPPSLFPGTLFHRSKLLFLSHSFTQMKSLRNSSALPGPSGTGHAMPYSKLDIKTLLFQLQLTVRSNFSLATSITQKCDRGKGLLKHNKKGTYCFPMGNFAGMTEQESYRVKVTVNISAQHRKPQPWQASRNLQVLDM